MASRWSQGMTSRPACGPVASWIPTPGPVAYQPQPGFLTDTVIVRGSVQVRPSSWLEVTRTSWLFRQKVSQIVPVVESTTGHGLPIAIGCVPPSSGTSVVAPQVRPPSSLRRITMSMSPLSEAPVLRPSQKARSVPLGVTRSDGMRYVWYPPVPLLNTSVVNRSSAALEDSRPETPPRTSARAETRMKATDLGMG